jgi:hypothetical protein
MPQRCWVPAVALAGGDGGDSDGGANDSSTGAQLAAALLEPRAVQLYRLAPDPDDHARVGPRVTALRAVGAPTPHDIVAFALSSAPPTTSAAAPGASVSLYTLGADDVLRCWDVLSGKQRWYWSAAEAAAEAAARHASDRRKSGRQPAAAAGPGLSNEVGGGVESVAAANDSSERTERVRPRPPRGSGTDPRHYLALEHERQLQLVEDVAGGDGVKGGVLLLSSPSSVRAFECRTGRLLWRVDFPRPSRHGRHDASQCAMRGGVLVCVLREELDRSDWKSALSLHAQHALGAGGVELVCLRAARQKLELWRVVRCLFGWLGFGVVRPSRHNDPRPFHLPKSPPLRCEGCFRHGPPWPRLESVHFD